MLAEADRLVGGEEAFLIIDDTCLPKKGERSVGVAPQYASSPGKTANCQLSVSMTLASRKVPVAVGLRLFLPEAWTNDPDRMARARVPKDRQRALSKPEIAIAEIDRVRAAGVRFGCVLADAVHVSSGLFRQALSARGLAWAVGTSRRQNVYPADVGLVIPFPETPFEKIAKFESSCTFVYSFPITLYRGFVLAFPLALVPVAVSALRSFVTLRRRVVDIRDLQQLNDPLPILLPAPAQRLLADEVNDPNRMRAAFTGDPVYRAALDVRGLTGQFDAFLEKKDVSTGEELDPERRQDMFWRFMGLFYQIRGQTNGSPDSDIEIDEAGIDQFLVRSAVATGRPGSVKVLRAVAETLVDFLGDNASVFLSRSSNKLVLSTILREFAARTDLETDSSNRLLKILMGSVAVAAAENGSEISEHPAATLLFNSLGRVRDAHGDDFVARIVTHAGFTSVVSDWTSNLATDPYLVDLVADLRGLDDGSFDPEDSSTLPADLQMALGALTNTVKVIGDNIGARDPLDREDRFRAVFAAALSGMSRNSAALLHQELDGDRFMGSLLEAVIATVGRTGTIQNNDLIAPVFQNMLDVLSGVAVELGQDRTLSRAEEILQVLAVRFTSDGLKKTLTDLEPLVGVKGARLIVAEVFAAAQANSDIQKAGDIERLHAIAETLLNDVPVLLAQGFDSPAAMRLVKGVMARIVPEDTTDGALFADVLPNLIELVEALKSRHGKLDVDTLEAIYDALLIRFETDAPVWQVLGDAKLTRPMIQAIVAVLSGDAVPARVPTGILVQIAERSLGKLSSHGLDLSDLVAGADDPGRQLRDMTEALLEQALRAAFEKLGRKASGEDVPEIVSEILERALAKGPVTTLSDLEMGGVLKEIIANLR